MITVIIALKSPVKSGEILSNGQIRLKIGEKEEIEVVSDCVINSGGLHASSIAHSIINFPKHLIPSIHYAKGFFC